MRVVNFTPHLLYPQTKNLQYSLNRKLSRPQGQSKCSDADKFTCPSLELKPGLSHMLLNHYTDYISDSLILKKEKELNDIQYFTDASKSILQTSSNTNRIGKFGGRIPSACHSNWFLIHHSSWFCKISTNYNYRQLQQARPCTCNITLWPIHKMFILLWLS